MIASPTADPAAVLARLRRAESAEAFFAILGVGYDPAVLARARLHVLKRMAARLDGVDLAALPAAEAVARARATLVAAHADFAASTPLAERVFKVLRQHRPGEDGGDGSGGSGRAGGAFVPIEDLAGVFAEAPAPADAATD